ncbi:MAG: Tn3 family transposase [Gammaproteobacteria bacterium]|nr:Tn3 family transposase [Gammaproteobacteria bacterium]
MTSIYKTAYPYYSTKKRISGEVLAADYRLTRAELWMIKEDSQNADLQLSYGVLLLIFKNLGYFPEPSTIPIEVVVCVKEQLKIPNSNFIINTYIVSRYRQQIYDHFKITRWKKIRPKYARFHVNLVEQFAIDAALEAAKTMNYPADIINVVIEQLKKNGYELPSFKQLDRLVKHAKTTVNQEIFESVYQSLTGTESKLLDDLLKTTADYMRSAYNDIKTQPKNPTITHFKELLQHHDWLVELGDIGRHLKKITPVKLHQFAQQANSLDASDLKDFKKPKRYTLMLSLILYAQTKAKDALALTYCKTIIKMHKKGKDKLDILKQAYRERTQELLGIFSDILFDIKDGPRTTKTLRKIYRKVEKQGGADALQTDCEQAIAFNGNNYLPLLWDFYRNKRPTLLRLLRTLDLQSSTQQESLINAIKYVLEHAHLKEEYVNDQIDLSFTTNQWQDLILKKRKKKLLNRRYLELCVLSHVANDLRSGDLFVVGADFYDDYRKGLLQWELCEKILGEYCAKTKIANNSRTFVKHLKIKLANKAAKVDASYPELTEFVIDATGNPILKRRGPKRRPSSAVWLEKELKSRVPERNLIDVLSSSHFYCGWAHDLGPVSGDEPKIKDAINRYILTSFAYATGLGPTQTSQHVRDSVSAHMISWLNKRHVTAEMLDKAREKLINLINQFTLIKSWGEGKSVAADGTLQELREQNIISEFHVRYQKRGGIAYHHVADNYILLFSTFMPCGVWEAVEIIEGLLKNDSDLQPDIIHGDTQSQSTVVFALSYLLGFRLMPRIRNWKDTKFARPDKESTYKHIDSLFGDPINWGLIEMHWQDMMQVVLSIYEGKISSSVLLRKLGNYSRKNRLYQAFQELGRVIKTLFLLDYISDVELRETITAQTNKVEAFNGLSDWCAFGSSILVASNDDIEMEKAVKYNDILANAVILQNVADMTEVIAQLTNEGHVVKKEDMAYLSPYWTEHLKRFGDIIMDLENIPKSVEKSRRRVLW